MAQVSASEQDSYGTLQSLPDLLVFVSFLAIGFYNSAVIFVKIFLSFRRYNSLYFWSLLVAASGIPITSTGVILKIFAIGPVELALTLATLGWYFMVTGQSVVLYSRLHLLQPSRRSLRLVLIMIIVDFFLFHCVMSVVYFPANILPYPNPWWTPFQVYEKIQVTAFAIQECTISGLYIYWTNRTFKPVWDLLGHKAKPLVRHLIAVNAFVILLDAVMVSTEYANLYDVQTTLKSAVYSVKLVLEFSVLDKLCKTVGNRNDRNNSFAVAGNPWEAIQHHDQRATIVGYANTAGKTDGIELHERATGIAVTRTIETAEVVSESPQSKSHSISPREMRRQSFGASYGTPTDNVQRSKSPSSSEIHFARTDG